mgnify:CR=1 FL=1
MKNKNEKLFIVAIVCIILCIPIGIIIGKSLINKNDTVNNVNENVTENESVKLKYNYSESDIITDNSIVTSLLSNIGLDKEDEVQEKYGCTLNFSLRDYYFNNGSFMDVISRYSERNNMLIMPPEEIYSSDECGVGSPTCRLITKTSIDKIISVYPFININMFKKSNLTNDYITASPYVCVSPEVITHNIVFIKYNHEYKYIGIDKIKTNYDETETIYYIFNDKMQLINIEK